MPTLMSEGTFNELTAVRGNLRDRQWVQDGNPMGIFVPWVGHRLKAKNRGIYLVGIALAAEEGEGEQQTFGASLTATENFIGEGRHGRSHTAFWRFLNCLTVGILDQPFYRCSDRWGWSNLLKIGWNSGTPSSWPRELAKAQRDACIESLREELNGLSDSLIFIASNNEYGILSPIRPGPWHIEQEAAGVWWQSDPQRGNLYVHGYHPNAALRFWNDMLGKTVELARSRLPAFES